MKIDLLFRLTVLAFAVGFLSGCATIKTLSKDTPCNKIYSGTIRYFTDFGLLGVLPVALGDLDLPFDMVLDTVVLPYTIPKTLVNYSREDSACNIVESIL